MSDTAVTTVRLDELHVTPLLQTRIAGTCKDTVNEYTNAARNGAKFPPLLAYRISDRGFKKPALVAGFHRYAAYQKAGITECEVEIRDGTLTDAWLAGWASNLTHGLRYKTEDKRKAAVTALKLYREDSAPVIAGRIGVSDEFIRKVRKQLIAVGQLEPTEKVTTRDGRSYPASLPDSPGASPTVGDAQDGAEEDHDDEPAPNTSTKVNRRAKLDKRERVERALLADPTRTDEQIALGTKADVALVASAREALRQKGEVPPAVPELDTWGIPIQPHAAEAFDDAHLFDALLAKLRECARDVDALSRSPAGAHLHLQYVETGTKAGGKHVLKSLEAVIAEIKRAKPAVSDCPYAFNEYQPHENCSVCRDKRWTGTVRERDFPPEMMTAMKAHYGITEVNG